MAISFDTNHKPVIGQVEQLENDLVVITADNASPMTFTGTRTYILGTKNLIVIERVLPLVLDDEILVDEQGC